MTTRRFTHLPPQPSLTRGDDRPEPACAKPYEAWKARLDTRRDLGLPAEPWCFDVLIDRKRDTHAYTAALREATDICRNCPLAFSCLVVENAGEEWAQAIRDGRKGDAA